MAVITVVAILASATLGYYLYSEYAGGANAIYDGVATASAALWVLAGIFAVMGGFVLPGMILIIIFTYVGLSKGSVTSDRLRARLAG